MAAPYTWPIPAILSRLIVLIYFGPLSCFPAVLWQSILSADVKLCRFVEAVRGLSP